MKYLHEPLAKAAKYCVEELRHDGGIGGVIALDNQGNGMHQTVRSRFVQTLTPVYPNTVAMPLNCSGMYRGIVREDGVLKTAIFDDDELE